MDKYINIEKYKSFKNAVFIDSGETNHSSRTIIIVVNDKHISISYSPTINCQISSIGGIYNILFLQNKEVVLKDILMLMRGQDMMKRMIMVDINVMYVTEMKELFKPYLQKNSYTDQKISLEAPYTSTNGSKMCILLFNINWNEVIN